nr:retrovirus-related Pol polyprotein from transposon TNT 1-94 [Tanacetum cinerariifolium]
MLVIVDPPGDTTEPTTQRRRFLTQVTAIEESKDLTSLSLDELLENIKVHEMIIKKDSEIVKAKVERKSIALRLGKESSDKECSTSGCEDEEYAMAICLGVDLEPDEWIKDSGCSKRMTGNRKLFSTYKAYNRGNVLFGSNFHGNIIGKGQICDNKCRVTFSEHDSEITKDGKVIGRGYSQNSKAYIVLNKHNKKVKQSLNVTFNETPTLSKTSPLVDNDLDEGEAIKVIEKKNLENDIVDETLEIDEIVNIKESRNHPLENVIGNLNQRSLRSQVQNKSNFFCFISTIEPKNVNEALGDESWIVAMQEELNQFIANDVWELVTQPKNMKIIGTKWVFRNNLDKNSIVSRNKARLVAQGYNQQEGTDYDEIYALVARLESIRILLAYTCALDFKLFQMDVKSAFLNGFINEDVYVAQPLEFIDFKKPDHVYKLKKDLYGLKQAPKDWLPKSLTGTTHLGLWYPKGTGIKAVVYADSDHAGDCVDRKSTSGIFTFLGCYLTSWFSKKQTALAISTTKAEYVSAGKACQQELWMKQALIDYDLLFATQDYPFSSLPPDAMIDENDDESSHPNSSSPSQQVSSSSTVVSRVHQNPSHESHIFDTFLSETMNHQTQQRDAHRDGLRLIGQTLKHIMGGKRK